MRDRLDGFHKNGKKSDESVDCRLIIQSRHINVSLQKLSSPNGARRCASENM